MMTYKYLKIIGILLIAVFFSYCNTLPDNKIAKVQIIRTGAGPEDMVIDTSAGEPRLLIACSSRREGDPEYGEIEVFQPANNKHIVLERVGEPGDISFHPHGIDIITLEGIPYLYVISHDDNLDQHPVIRYRITTTQLIFDKLYSSPLLISPNALTVYDDESFLICNDAKKRGNKAEQILGLKTGNVVYFDGKGNWTIIADKLGMPAGINHLDDRVFVSTATGDRLFEYHYEKAQLSDKKVLSKIKGADNIRFFGDNIIVAGHVKPFKFIRHLANAKNPSPTNIYLVNTTNGDTKVLYSDDGRVISAGSVGIELNGRLYIGEVFEDHIVEIEAR